MTDRKPELSLLILTYNRAHLLEKTIESVLQQTFQDFEIILVNNGSKDDTKIRLKKYEQHPKVRIFHLEKNRGFAGGLNFGLEQNRGTWFTTLGDDDLIEPHAFETLLQVPQNIDPAINAVSCNGWDTGTKSFSGKGLDKDQYLPIETIAGKTDGDFWGITRSDLIGDKRINEKIPGLENTFWYQIDAIAHRYYIHQSLITYCTDHGPRETDRQGDFAIRSKMYQELLSEKFFWKVLRKHNPNQYLTRCLKGIFFLKLSGFSKGVKAYQQMAGQVEMNLKYKVLLILFSNVPIPILKRMVQLYQCFLD